MCDVYNFIVMLNAEFLEVSPDVAGFGLRRHVFAQVEFVGVDDIPVNLHLAVLMKRALYGLVVVCHLPVF